jgi:hypothetical protein
MRYDPASGPMPTTAEDDGEGMATRWPARRRMGRIGTTTTTNELMNNK